MGQRRRDKKQRKLTQQTTAAIYATASANQAAQTQQMAMQAEQLRIAQMHAAEAQAAAALAQQQAARQAYDVAATAAEVPGWRPDPAGTHQLRWWGGVSWTDQVSDNGIQSTDPDFGDSVGSEPVGEIGPGPSALPASTQAPEALPSSTSSMGSGTSLTVQLRELAELRDQGILTDDEFQAQKAKLLG